jgi:LSD1 subclass zinc finger protein
MGLPAEKPRRATYADLEAVPDDQVAEILNGALHVFPRPALAHARTSSRLGIKLGGPFDLGEGGPGGWHILDEPELHLGPAHAEDVLVPDLAGWRVARLPRVPRKASLALAPDWVCEVLSRRTEATDRAEKMPIYAREGVRHAWLIHPLRQTLEVFALDPDGCWKLLAVHQGAKRVRCAPFAELELELTLLWPEEEQGSDDQDGDEGEGTSPPVALTSRARPIAPRARKRART